MKGELNMRDAALACVAAGVVVGIISSTPVLMFPNICCLWIILGGFAAAYMASRRQGSIEPLEAALVGAFFGIVYGVTVNIATFIIRIPLNLLHLGVAARGVTGSGIIDMLGIKLGFGSILVVFLNVALGILFGAFGGVLYSVSIESGGGVPSPYKKTKPGLR